MAKRRASGLVSASQFDGFVQDFKAHLKSEFKIFLQLLIKMAVL
jgi:hypothetical protein